MLRLSVKACSESYCIIPLARLLLDFSSTLLASQGLGPNYLKVVPSIAIAFVSYEQIKDFLGVEFRIPD